MAARCQCRDDHCIINKERGRRMTSSKQPRKQRRALRDMPLHRRRRKMSARLTRELQLKHRKKQLGVVKGDSVRVMRGEFKGVEGEVTAIDTKTGRLSIDGVTREKADGSTMYYPIHLSKVELTKLHEKDPWRGKILEQRRQIESTEVKKREN